MPAGDGGAVVSRPDTDAIRHALKVLECVVADAEAGHFRAPSALKVLRAGVKPRPVWPAKEVGEYLGVNPANLRVGRMQNFDKFPAPAQELPRPTEKDPAKTVRFWFVDEVQDFKRNYMKGGQ